MEDFGGFKCLRCGQRIGSGYENEFKSLLP